jgi:hypothetical protein
MATQIAYVTDQGNVHLFDARMPNQLITSQKAHNISVNDVKTSNNNLLFTCS